MEFVAQFVHSELHFGLSRVVVVRNHDFVVWIARKPENHGGVYGDFDSDNLFDLHFSVFLKFRSFHQSRERTWRQKPEKSEARRDYRATFQFSVGIFGNGVHISDEEELGEFVYFGCGNHQIDDARFTDYRAVRARELPADDGVRRFEGDGAAEIGGEY